MVDFNTRIFTEDDGKIIGAEITVLSTSGDNLGSISVANAETLAEMQAQLAVIDETYFTEERLEEILANISENTSINATKLNGFLSSDFAKVSQLSNYAPVSHNHNINQINGLYDYQIYASNYNVNIDSTVNIIVKVTNRATGNPVVGVTVPVLKNNETWQSGTTGVNGTFSLSYTADTWGLTTFSAKTQDSIQILIKGYKQVQSIVSDKIKVYTNGTDVQLSVQGSFTLPSKTETQIGKINSDYAPSSITSVLGHFTTPNFLIGIGSDGTITGYNYTSSSGTMTARSIVTYPLKSSIL